MLQLYGAIDTKEATVYLDDTDAFLAYVLPKVPTIRRDGERFVFQFVKYRTLKPMKNGEIGAGLVFMDVELALRPEQEQAVRQAVADQLTTEQGAGAEPVDPAKIVLSKPQVTKATVAIEILAASETLVQKTNHAGSPSMYGNNVVAMSAELTQLGAPVFEAVMSSNAPAGGVRVVYSMEFAARLPPITAVGTWHASKFYNFVQDVDFEENFWSEDDFSEKVSELFTNSESRNIVVDPGGQANSDPEVAKVLDTVRGAVTTALDEAVKRNLLEAIPPENRDFSKIRDEDFENIHREVTVNKQSDVTVRFTEKQVASVPVYPQANMPSLVSQGGDWNDYSMEVDTDHPFFRTLNLNILVNADFETLPIFSVDVTIDYPPATAKHGKKTFTFTKADDIGKFSAFTDGGSTQFNYHYVVHYEGESRTFKSRTEAADTDTLTIDVDELGLWLVDIEVGDMNFEQVSRAVLTLEHPEVAPGIPPVRQFQIDRENQSHQLKELLLQPVQPYKAQIKFFMADGREFVRELPAQRGQRLYVDDPFSATKELLIHTRGDFENRIDTIFVDAVYDDATNKYRQTRSIALSKDKRNDTWSIPVIDERAGKLTYRAITTFKDGTSSDSGEQTVTGTTLLLGEDVATLTVVMVPDLIPWDTVKLATVELHYTDPANGIDERETFTFRKGPEGGAAEQTYELAVRDKTKLAYAWAVTFFMIDGTKKEATSNGPVTTDKLIIEPPV